MSVSAGHGIGVANRRWLVRGAGCPPAVSAARRGARQTAGMLRAVSALLLSLASLASLVGCGGSDAAGPTDGRLQGRLVVLAAASLAGTLPEVADRFELEHADVSVELSFDGSARLAAALVEGAPADVFASADEANLRAVQGAGRAGPPSLFASNQLQIVVAAGNPLQIDDLADLTDPSVAVALCADGVPCGTYARQAFEQAGLAVPAAGGEASVTAVLARVRLGEADAGLVYATDVAGAAGLAGIPLPAGQQVTATYPAVALTDAAHPEAAASFVAFLTSRPAQAILRSHGFGPP